jgi:hypothetical protein
MSEYIVRYSDDTTARVQASSKESARNRGCAINGSGVVVDVEKV